MIKQNRFLESVLNALSDGLIIVDKNSNILKVTPKISNWFAQNNKKQFDEAHKASITSGSFSEPAITADGKLMV